MDRILGRIPEPADLYQSLAQALVTTNGKTVLRHRFVIADPYDPKYNGHYNKTAADKEQSAEQFKAEQKWWDYVEAHEKDFWPIVLEEIKDSTPLTDWMHAIRRAWYDSDIIWKNRDVWIRLFADRSRLAGISTPDEAAHFAKQRDPLTVYRGCLPEHVRGMSWSLTYGAAEHFARRLLPRGIIVEGTVKKEHVIVYLSPNNEEDEVIVSPEHVTDIVSVGYS